MRNGKFAKKGAMSKTLVLVLSLILIIGCVTGGTLAWLLDTSDPVKNTFTESDIGVDLDETTGEEYKMVPGWTIEKDPVVIVEGGSEDCWVFIKVEEKIGEVKVGNTTYTFDDFIAYQIDTDNWTQLTDKEGNSVADVYCCKANDITADRKIKVLGPGSKAINDVTYEWSNNQVLTLPTVTKEMMDVLEADTSKYPTLTFTAYASQLWKNNETEFTAAEAWANLNPTT